MEREGSNNIQCPLCGAFLISLRGALKYHIKAYSLAVKDLTEAVAIDCKCALAYFNRAVCYHEMRFFQKVGLSGCLRWFFVACKQARFCGKADMPDPRLG